MGEQEESKASEGKANFAPSVCSTLMVEIREARNIIVQIVSSSINELVSYFIENPYHFYTENDLHCHLFHRIFQKLEVSRLNKPLLTSDGKMSILLHKEYPTKVRYRRNRTPLELKKMNELGAFYLLLNDTGTRETNPVARKVFNAFF